MDENSKIEWTHHTFNPWRGCTKVSAGCANCYADTLSHRNPRTLGIWGPRGTRVVAAESAWKEPLKWNRLAGEAGERHRVFCASLADVFEGSDTMPPGYDGLIGNARARLFELIMRTPHLDWLLLTKRPENIMPLVVETFEKRLVIENPWPLPNVWIGTSVEDQAAADKRIPELLKVPAAVRFLSMEPLIGSVHTGLGTKTFKRTPVEHLIHWVIVGGESGHGARPFNIEWARSIVGQCKVAGVAAFVKQLGASPRCGCRPDGLDHAAIARALGASHSHCMRCGFVLPRDRKGGDWSEWPEDLRVREFPTSSEARR